MQDTSKYLLEETNAIVAYVQSDEISLPADSKSEFIFNGKFQKLTLTLAAMCSSFFAVNAFDCRVWQVSNKVEAANVFYCRELGAAKNAISMVTQSVFSHKESRI